MNKYFKFVIFFGIVSALFVFGPLIIPLPPLAGTQPVDELIYADSQFEEIHQIRIHTIRAGKGEKLILLLHGFGSSTYSWRKVMQSFSIYGTTIAYDRPAFGLTERLIPGEDLDFNPYTLDYQVELAAGLIEQQGSEQAVLVGNSAGGTVAIGTALKYPEKVKALILVDAAVYGGSGAPEWIKPMLNLPQFDRLGPIFVRTIEDRGLEILKMAWSDPNKISYEDLENYQLPLKMEDWDRALWEYTKVNGDHHFSEKLGNLTVPVLIISGNDDQLIPVENSVRLANEIPHAQLVIIPDCGHVPQEECPKEFISAVEDFLKENP
jgi:pimeloyl-ACP methyl ester carboxylesterase